LFAGRDISADYKPRQPFYATTAALSPMGFSQTRQSMTPPPGQSQNLPIGGWNQFVAGVNKCIMGALLARE